jgi:hypothetical protein
VKKTDVKRDEPLKRAIPPESKLLLVISLKISYNEITLTSSFAKQAEALYGCPQTFIPWVFPGSTERPDYHPL